MPNSRAGTNYRRGTEYAVAAAALLAVQAPFSALAARDLSPLLFVCVTQIALLASVPLLIARGGGRRDFFALLLDAGNRGKLAVLFVAGLVGLLLYNVGLSAAHPIVTAAVLNLSPFWAALVAWLISKKSIPVSPLVFSGCFLVAFAGAMMIASSQMTSKNWETLGDIFKDILHGTWIYAIPTPIFFALSGTLVFKWFSRFEESAVIAVNFVVSAAILIPATAVMAYIDHSSHAGEGSTTAILLLLAGTLASSAAGRVFYQLALTVTDNDNGFVTMFFLLIPGMAALVSIPLSWAIPEMRVAAGPLFFLGLALVTIPLAIFSLKSWRVSAGPADSPAPAE